MRQRSRNPVGLVAACLLAVVFYQVVGAQPTPNCREFVSGGGWYIWGNEGANFGFNAGYQKNDGSLSGHMDFVDHNIGMHVVGATVDDYIAHTGTDRAFEGDATVNGEPGYRYLVEVIDNGDPGRGDLFRIAVSNNYCSDSRFQGGGCDGLQQFDGILEGGNIQIHRPCVHES